MATNLLADLGRIAVRSGSRAVRNVGAAYLAYKGYQYGKRAMEAAKTTRRIRNIRQGVRRAVRSFASGTRQEIAQKIREMRKDPNARLQLRKRIRIYTPVR